MAEARPYQALAALYDVVMEHVDYPYWAEYVHLLLREFADAQGVRDVLELGGGTGSLAFELQPLGPYRYACTDASPEMLAVAARKADAFGGDVLFAEADFTGFSVDAPVDAVLLLYDGLNYLLDPAAFAGVFESVARALRPGGLFIFDQSTPANSLNNADGFDDEGEAGGVRYVRRSHYDPATHLHTNAFTFHLDGEEVTETHVQRAYTMEDVRARIPETFRVEIALDSFSDEVATHESERIHWILRRVN